MVKNNKKAISPVVATALLLVVAVVAVVGFQTWFTTYQSNVLTDVEQQTATGNPVTVERLALNTTNNDGPIIYLKNTGDTQITFTSSTITDGSGGSCTNAWSGSLNATAATVSIKTNTSPCTSALTAGEVADIILVSDTGVMSVETIIR